MEGELDLPFNHSKQNHSTMEEFPSQTFLERNIQSSFIWVNPCTHTISGLPNLSMIQGESSSTVKHLNSDTLQTFAGQQLSDVHNLPISLPQEGARSDGLQAMLNYGLLAEHLGGTMVPSDWMTQNYMNLCDSNNRNSESGKQSMKSSQLSHILSQPRYLSVVQEILSQFASFSLENMDRQIAHSYLDHCAEQGDSFKGSDESSNMGGVEPLSYQRRENEARKSQLLALLQMLDDCYNQCLDEIHTVISAFHAATELDPHRHASFALRTISVVYKSLKERISKQILKMGALNDDGGDGSSDACVASGSCSRDQMERSFEKSFIQKQWALQQLKRKDQQVWRPQRGLPERSVSVLRAWMFQNFLHPYPKDAEKHLLAMKSGLTRSQVSNWFINARVRLWKPLIEEMYAELNRSKSANGNQGNEESNTYNSLSFHNSTYSTS